MMARHKIFNRFIAVGLRVGGMKLSKEFDVSILTFKAEPVCIIGKDVGTTGAAKLVGV